MRFAFFEVWGRGGGGGGVSWGLERGVSTCRTGFGRTGRR